MREKFGDADVQGGRGVSKISDSPGRGGRGVKKGPIFVDVLYGWPQRLNDITGKDD